MIELPSFTKFVVVHLWSVLHSRGTKHGVT